MKHDPVAHWFLNDRSPSIQLLLWFQLFFDPAHSQIDSLGRDVQNLHATKLFTLLKSNLLYIFTLFVFTITIQDVLNVLRFYCIHYIHITHSYYTSILTMCHSFMLTLVIFASFLLVGQILIPRNPKMAPYSFLIKFGEQCVIDLKILWMQAANNFDT